MAVWFAERCVRLVRLFFHADRMDGTNLWKNMPDTLVSEPERSEKTVKLCGLKLRQADEKRIKSEEAVGHC